MNRQPVTSTTLASVGYDPTRQILDLEFNTGALYRYYRVPRNVHEDLLHAESLGAYFNETIRDNYDFERLNPAA